MKTHVIGATGFLVATLLSASLATIHDSFARVIEQQGSSAARSVSNAQISRSPQAATPKQRPRDRQLPRFTFEGTLLAFEQREFLPCGIIASYERARYRISRVIEGDCNASEIVVDHLACETSVFNGFRIGDRVQVTVKVDIGHDAGFSASGSKQDQFIPGVVFVAIHAPLRVDGDTLSAPPN